MPHRARRRGRRADGLGQHGEFGARQRARVILVGERLATVPGALTAPPRWPRTTGARLAWVPRRAGDRGAVEAGCLPNLLPGGRPVADAAARVDAATAWGVDHLPETSAATPTRSSRPPPPASSAAWSSAASTPTTWPTRRRARAAIAAAVRGRPRAPRDRRDPGRRRGVPGRAGQRQGRHVRQLGGSRRGRSTRSAAPGVAARPAGPGRHRRGARHARSGFRTVAEVRRQMEEFGPWDGERARRGRCRAAGRRARPDHRRARARLLEADARRRLACRTATTTCGRPPAPPVARRRAEATYAAARAATRDRHRRPGLDHAAGRGRPTCPTASSGCRANSPGTASLATWPARLPRSTVKGATCVSVPRTDRSRARRPASTTCRLRPRPVVADRSSRPC